MTLRHARSYAAVLCVGVTIAAAGSVSCARPPVEEPALAARVLTPGSRMLQPPTLGTSSERLTVSVRRSTDSTERAFTGVTHGETPVAGHADRAVLTTAWEPPYDSRDTLVVVSATIAPVEETLFFGRVLRRFRYDGRHVMGTMQPVDSAARSYDTTFAEPVFAFNEVELLVRSLRYARGLQVIAPLFSEVDLALEHDTLSVVGRSAIAGADSAWVVRFADPVIVSTYVVDPRTRTILDARTRQRRSGSVLHYVRGSAG